MIALPYNLFKLLVLTLGSLCIASIVGDYVCALTSHVPPPNSGLLIHTIVGSMLGLLIVPRQKTDNALKDTNPDLGGGSGSDVHP